MSKQSKIRNHQPNPIASFVSQLKDSFCFYDEFLLEENLSKSPSNKKFKCKELQIDEVNSDHSGQCLFNLEESQKDRKSTADSQELFGECESTEIWKMKSITQWDNQILIKSSNSAIFDAQYFLLSLDMSSNHIVSIENLTNLYSPSLVSLVLTDNMIVSVKSLRKCYFPKLQKLSLDVNQINQFESISEANFKQVTQINIDRLYWKGKIENIGFLAKIQSNQLRVCFLERRNRIANIKMTQSLAKRFKMRPTQLFSE